MAKEKHSFLSSIKSPISITTAIDSQSRFPEILDTTLEKYKADIALFRKFVAEAESSGALLGMIRSTAVPAKARISMLKIFRRAVCSVLDTEMARKITIVKTEELVSNFGTLFKPIDLLKTQFQNLSDDQVSCLAALIGEYDTRGASGYSLTAMFFEWFEANFAGKLEIRGPRGAGRDVELKDVFPEYEGNYPCDFVISEKGSGKVLAIGFARYDSTRGGAQSDDRTGGNANKVDKAREFCQKFRKKFKIVFLADGPGLIHSDTWNEACILDGSWEGNVRVTTIKIAEERVTLDWLLS